jgi:transcriptional regulator with XRE-family HTH domain
MGVGQRLREIRLLKKVGLRELARALPISHPALAQYESGDSRIDADMLPLIAAALGVSPCAFFEEGPAPAEPAVEAVARRAAEIALEKVHTELRSAVDDIVATASQPTPSVEGEERPTIAQVYMRKRVEGFYGLTEKQQEEVWARVEERKRRERQESQP